MRLHPGVAPAEAAVAEDGGAYFLPEKYSKLGRIELNIGTICESAGSADKYLGQEDEHVTTQSGIITALTDCGLSYEERRQRRREKKQLHHMKRRFKKAAINEGAKPRSEYLRVLKKTYKAQKKIYLQTHTWEQFYQLKFEVMNEVLGV